LSYLVAAHVTPASKLGLHLCFLISFSHHQHQAGLMYQFWVAVRNGRMETLSQELPTVEVTLPHDTNHRRPQDLDRCPEEAPPLSLNQPNM
jgi:hypothetical protein